MPPCGCRNGKVGRRPLLLRPPAGHLLGRDYKCRKQLSAGDARGEAPCIRKPKPPPFPVGRGAGGWGQERKPKAWLAGDQNRRAPAGHR